MKVEVRDDGLGLVGWVDVPEVALAPALSAVMLPTGGDEPLVLDWGRPYKAPIDDKERDYLLTQPLASVDLAGRVHWMALRLGKCDPEALRGAQGFKEAQGQP